MKGNADAWIAEARAKGLDISVSGGPPTPVPARREQPVETTAPRRLVVEVDVPIRTASEANGGGKRRDKIARKVAVKEATKAALPIIASPFPLPAIVTLTRFGTRKLDDDNLQRALKAVRDVVAAHVFNLDDADRRVVWQYEQQAAWESFVRVRIEHKGT